MDINYVNSLLHKGNTVKEIREILGYSEKKFQKEIKSLGYKYEQKLKQYIPLNDSNCNSNTLCNTASNTNEIIDIQKESLNFIGENIELLNSKNSMCFLVI